MVIWILPYQLGMVSIKLARHLVLVYGIWYEYKHVVSRADTQCWYLYRCIPTFSLKNNMKCKYEMAVAILNQSWALRLETRDLM